MLHFNIIWVQEMFTTGKMLATLGCDRAFEFAEMAN
jgi:hypothetical protein